MWSKKTARTAQFEQPSRYPHENLYYNRNWHCSILWLLTVRPRQMRENKKNKRGRNKTALPRFLSFTVCRQTNVVSGALIELAGNKKIKLKVSFRNSGARSIFLIDKIVGLRAKKKRQSSYYSNGFSNATCYLSLRRF